MDKDNYVPEGCPNCEAPKLAGREGYSCDCSLAQRMAAVTRVRRLRKGKHGH